MKRWILFLIILILSIVIGIQYKIISNTRKELISCNTEISNLTSKMEIAATDFKRNEGEMSNIKEMLSNSKDNESLLQSEIDNLEKELESFTNNKKFFKSDIEIEFEKALDDWDGSTYEGVWIIGTCSSLWYEEIEKYYQLIYEQLSDDKKNSLVVSQEKWIEFAIANESLSWQISDQNYHGGTIMKIEEAFINYNSNRNRALDLISKYKALTLDGYDGNFGY